MKKVFVVLVIMITLSSYPLVAKAVNATNYEAAKTSYNEAEEAAKRAIRHIKLASDLVYGDWDAIEIDGLYTRLFDEITTAVTENGEICGYQITETKYSDDGQYFSIRVEKTIYCIKKGDTLSKIAQNFGTTVEELQKLNPEISNPDKIYAGTILRIK